MNYSRIILSISLLLSLLQSLSFATSSHDAFIQCLENHSNSSISSLIYTQNNSSYSSILQNYIRNLRFNESYTPKPQIIIIAGQISDIQTAIFCGKAHKMQMKIRSGGHDYEGVSYWSDEPDFFVLDMFRLRSIDVDVQDESAWVEVGATLGEVYYRIAEKSPVHGFPAGVCPTVGVGGHLSGGGYGNMMRKFGLTIDNVVDATMVDVRGRLLDRKAMGEELFWAITGGGGSSFGVVVLYKIKIVRVPNGRMADIPPSEKPFPHRAGNIAKLQYATNWNEQGAEAANRYLNLTRELYEFMTPYVSMAPREAFLNYRDLDIGVNHNGRNSYLEGLVFGTSYFKENFNKLVKVKTRVDKDNYFRNEQSIPVFPWKK
ncbi:LOW QUALITY PROTEIN: berberine bridge enzyme-like 8 [Salvia hispanica]|uniref:LOW QUALITY PROTEIN: berberine bridge enzyme-like 8 n=1 Tax=Salvia hispanica TaxID=49212 RepID=UPI0020097DA7|nr:LOW QUALITY PROTEIN: berberine bridge enzyme-like 8 [Salvia hispanica]